MNPLLSKIVHHIKSCGFIDVHTFMSMALYDLEYGYYFTKNVIGKDGDYITSPEISQVFGEILACWFINQWHIAGEPEKCNIIEFGPGRGTLMADMLRVFSKHSKFWSALQNIVLVEVSPILREKQKRNLNNYFEKIIHIDSIQQYNTDLSSTNFVIANEFFDALPIQQFIGEKNPRKILLTTNNVLEFEQQYDEETAIREVCPDYELIIQKICNLIGSKGAALVIDYGFYHQQLFGNTLQALKHKRYADILTTPGEADLSHHVNFANLQNFIPCEFQVNVSTQQDFLIKHGIIERTQQLASKANTTQQKNHILTATARLTMPQHMGRLFKVMQIVNSYANPSSLL